MPDDARLLELTWLSEIEQGTKPFGPFRNDCPERRLAVHLLSQSYVVSPHTPAPAVMGRGQPLEIRQYYDEVRWQLIDQAMNGHVAFFTITHAGAVRRAELEQQLKTGRIKEPMGLVWDGRHFRQDARIAILDATSERPLGVVYLDLNDVRAFNAKSHAIGDEVIRRYLGIVADLVYDRGDAYRLSGGADEVVVLLPRSDQDGALAWARRLLAALGRETVENLTLRAAAGVVSATESTESVDALKARADVEQIRAKTRSRDGAARPSVVAWPEGLEVVEQ